LEGLRLIQKRCHILLLVGVLLLFCACAHLPPGNHVETAFRVPAGIDEIRTACPSALVSYLKGNTNDKVSLRQTTEPDLVSCSIMNQGLLVCHWNILLHRNSDRETSMVIYRFVVQREGYVPISSGEEEQAFVTFLVKSLSKVHE
jgi:hypothetical protein